MRKLYVVMLLTLCAAVRVSAGDWMKRLPDNLFVSQVSIPGTHDAATASLDAFTASFGQCQDMDVDEQWSIGIRAFDLRPQVVQGEDGEEYLNVNHGIAKTRLRFDDALYMLRDSLKEHPSEFVVIHLLYAYKFDNYKDKYASLLQELLEREDLKDYFVPFRRSLTVGDMRGKMLLISRDPYATKPFTGGFFQTWCGYLDWNAQSNCTISGENTTTAFSAPLWVQDYSNTKDSEGGVDTKVKAVKEMLDHSTKHVTKDSSQVVWVFNFASSYPGGTSTANGYRENATHANAAIIEYLQTHDAGPTGVVLMDYCVDRSPNEETGEYATRGRELTDTLIANNFKWLEQRNKKVYDTQQKQIERLRSSLQELRDSMETAYKDVADQFTDTLAAVEASIDGAQHEMDSLYAGWMLTEAYTVDYSGISRIMRSIERAAKAAQAEYDATGVPTVRPDEVIDGDCQIFSVTGERVDALRRGVVNIVKFPDGKVRKVFYR